MSKRLTETETKTALEAVRAATEKLGVTLHVIEPKPGTGTITFLRKREADE